jgi:hypothetical protein
MRQIIPVPFKSELPAREFMISGKNNDKVLVIKDIFYFIAWKIVSFQMYLPH